MKRFVVNGLRGLFLAAAGLIFSVSCQGFFIPSAVAADEDGRFSVEGGGARSCESFLKAETDSSDEFTYLMGWMQGYLTGMNRFQPDTFDLVPWQNTRILTLALRGICQQDPQMNFFRAVDVLAVVLAPERLQESSPTLTLGDQEQQVVVYKAVLKRAQEKLRERGYLKGDADGNYGPATRKALEDFQKDSDETVTGLPDLISLYRLFSEKPDAP